MYITILFPQTSLEASHETLSDSTTQSDSSASSCSSTTAPMSEWKRDALTTLQLKLKNYLSLVELLDMLDKAAGGFMTRAEKMHVCGQPDRREKVGCIITLLQGKEDQDFDIFIDMLRNSGNKVWAIQLEKKAKDLRRKSRKGVCT